MILKYNNFFYTNACHICMRFGEGISLKRCGNCAMISYCSKEHQKEHWSKHKDLCKIICNILKDNRMSSFINRTENPTMEEWVQMKMNFMLMVAVRLPRKLKHYEQQMFQFLRSCAVCHNRNKKVLVDCPNCPSTSFCIEHKFDIMHQKLCNLLKLCYNLDKALMHHVKRVPEVNVPYQLNHRNLPKNMRDFIKYYVQEAEPLQLSMDENTMLNAEYLTRPLTLLYAMQKLGCLMKHNSIVIHIIAANIVELNGVELWEILLHWLSNVRVAKIILIGPELSSGSMSIGLCKECEEKELSIQMCGMFYHEYINDESYSKPDFIIGYNAGIHEYEEFNSENDTWPQSLKIISKQSCPFIVTSYTLAEVEKEHKRLNAILNNSIRYKYCEQNPYGSLRPYRDFETESVYYQNQYILIYDFNNTINDYL